MAKSTTATQHLVNNEISFSFHPYDYDANATKVGMQAAQSLGFLPEQVFKTLMVEIDKTPCCVIIPSDQEISFKKLCHIMGGKSGNMMKPELAEKMTGFKVGGISPFGQRKKVPTAIDESCILFDTIYINGGQRGLLIGISPDDAIKTAEAAIGDIIA